MYLKLNKLFLKFHYLARAWAQLNKKRYCDKRRFGPVQVVKEV